MFVVCEIWVGDRDRLLYWPPSSSLTIAALLPHLGWVAQPEVTKGPKALCLELVLTSASCLQLTLTALGTWLYYFLTSTWFRYSSANLHRCVSWLTVGKYVHHGPFVAIGISWTSLKVSWSYLKEKSSWL